MTHDVLGRAGPGLMPGPTAVVAPVRGRVTWGQVALALVELSGVGSSASTHLLASLRSIGRDYAAWASSGARRKDLVNARWWCRQRLDTNGEVNLMSGRQHGAERSAVTPTCRSGSLIGGSQRVGEA